MMSNLQAGLITLCDSLNVMGGERDKEEAVVRWFGVMHRTMQQTFMRIVIVPILRHLAESYATGRLDGRNMASGRLASRMLKDLNDDDLYLPFV